MSFRSAITSRFVAISPVPFEKVESKVESGFARIAQKIEVTTSPLVMSYNEVIGHSVITHSPRNVKAILSGESGLAAWNKRVFEYHGVKFVMCPITEVLGFEIIQGE